jgi:antitoxin (DNA-binding transcriptional repressor) of toxin-antitoxin stability system
MQSITLRQLRDTKQVKAWLRAGEHVELRERGEVIGDLVPRTPAKIDRSKIEWPDFEARAKAIFGDRIIPAVEMLIQDREDEQF